jgi:hypothetical protein
VTAPPAVAALAVAIARSRSTVGVGSRSMPSRAVLVTADTRPVGVEVHDQVAADHAQALLDLLVADVVMPSSSRLTS